VPLSVQIASGVLIIISVSSPSGLAGSDATRHAPKPSAKVSDSEIHLRIGDAYEKSGQFDKAEAEYVIAAADAAPDTQERALTNLGRILQFTADRNLQIAQIYESKAQWSDAEAYYLKAVESARTPVDRQTAIDGIKRVREHLLSPWTTPLERTEWLPKLGTLLLRSIGSLVVLLVGIRFFSALRAVAKSTKTWKFDGDDRLANLIQSAFPSVRAKTYSAMGSFNAVKLPQTLSTVYPFVPLHLDDYLPEEGIELGELKIPSLSSLLRLLVRPRIEIEGGISTTDSGSFVYAHVWRNQWFRTKLQTVATTTIPTIDLNGAALELFVYDIYLKTLRAMDRHELA
jgi:tetratricopeptide (TPR) repeat protein